MSWKSRLLSTATVLALALPGAAMAQQAEGQPQDGATNDIIVTAQKRQENVQSVPIAVSAFSEDMLKKKGMTGGESLQQAIPNVTFGSTGFGRFNFQIRGIGAQIQGASVDTGVGIHENNIPLTDSRLAAAEFYDIERVEVLRGPQGTLYGRNATGGVVNTITATPKQDFSAEITGELGRYNTRRLRGYVNVPLSDTLAVRAAGTMIKRDGTTFNSGTGHMVDSRDIWSTRITAQWQPSDDFRARLMWEHFSQNDTSGGNAKIICAPDAGPATIGGVPTNPLTQAFLANGCLANAAESPANNGVVSSLNILPGLFGMLFGVTPYNVFAGKTVSTNIATIDSSFDPTMNARNDLASLDLQWKVNPALTVSAISSFTYDRYTQNTVVLGGVPTLPLADTPLSPGGVFNDPQLGAGNQFNAHYFMDRHSKQFSQELRLQSDFSGKFNFNLGGIYIDYKQDGNLIALANTTTAAALAFNADGAGIGIDPNPVADGSGHNYYNNRSPYHLKSAAAFGEAYYKATDSLKITLGLRYTSDSKEQISYPVMLLTPGTGFPPTAPQQVTFRELTGRFTVDWKPRLAFTDDTLLYASFARGYKGGGFNPGGVVGSGVGSAFAPEFVNAFELGTKNTLADRKVTLNLTGFYYDYSGYQISKLVNQTVATENVSATVWGAEFEGAVEPFANFRLDTHIGYLGTRITGGSSIDILNLTQGDPSLAAVRSIDPGSFANECVLPVAVLADVQGGINAGAIPSLAMGALCSGPNAVPGAIAGVPVQLRGKQLPASPHWTISVGGEYRMEFGPEWTGTIRADFYHQAASYARIYNDVADRIRAWNNLNLAYVISSRKAGLDIMLYARDLLSQQAITNIVQQSQSLGTSRVVTGKNRSTYGIALTKRF